MDYDIHFINIINEFYPFDRYILIEPVQVNCLFDDVYLTEMFIPSVESKKMDYDKIYVKLQCNNIEFRMAYYDFNDHIREGIRDAIRFDIGTSAWEDLYVEHEEYPYELIDMLKTQKVLITDKYGKCSVKDSFILSDIIKMLDEDTQPTKES